MERTNSIKFVGDISRTGKHQSGQVFSRGVHTNRECDTTQTFDNGGKEMEEVRVVGGLGNIWGRQYHQQSRVYDTKLCSPAITPLTISGLYVKKWKSELNKQQKKDT